MNIHEYLSKKLNKALLSLGVKYTNNIVHIRKSSQIKFGDYQVDGIIAISKKNGLLPNNLAKKIFYKLELDNIAKKIEVTDSGFINIFLNKNWLKDQLKIILISSRLGINLVKKQNIVVDYSSPNMAKEMHVGHIRSTIIGDSMVRIFEFLGHNVIRSNHIGDWGTQFGMILAYLDSIKLNLSLKKIKLYNLENFYRIAKKNYDKDPLFAENSRKYVVKLQKYDNNCIKIWKKLLNLTINDNQKNYKLLNVTLTKDDIMGESIYKNMLPKIVEDLKNKGLAIEKEGATVVFLNEFKNKYGKSMGVIIKKKDGAYLYTTTDIACVKYRYEKFKAERIIYYIDSRQNQHLRQVWYIVRKANYIPESVKLEHHMLGMILGKNGKPFKTRTGDIAKLSELIDEALKRARNLIFDKTKNIKYSKIEYLSKIVGIGAIKYADLSKKRYKNYIFDWNKMLNFKGNTALYIQYAYTRIVSLLKKSNIINIYYLSDDLDLKEKEDIKLAVCLLQYHETINIVANDGMPHILCTYIYNLAVIFTNFYEKFPILKENNESLRNSRLKLALLTARTLKQGLSLLGIKTVEIM